MLITDFLRFVLPEVAGCPTPLVRQAVIDSAQEFFRESGIWHEVQDAQQVLSRGRDYEIDVPAGAVISGVRAVYAPFASGGELAGQTPQQLAARFGNWLDVQATLPTHYTRALDAEVVSVFPLPIEPPRGQKISIHAVFSLADTATELPDALLKDWREGIAAGAKQRLMVMPGVAWSNPALAGYYSSKFNDARVSADIDARHGSTAANLYVTPSRLFGR